MRAAGIHVYGADTGTLPTVAATIVLFLEALRLGSDLPDVVREDR